MKKYLSAFVCGFGAGVMQVVPVAKSFACCIIVPVAAYLAIVLYQKAHESTEKLPTKIGVIIGLLTGLYAALFGGFFDVFVTFVTKNNELVAAYPELLDMLDNFAVGEELQNEVELLVGGVVEDIRNQGFSIFYTIAVFLNNLIFDTIFGLIGGVIGTQIINSRKQRQSNQ